MIRKGEFLWSIRVTMISPVGRLELLSDGVSLTAVLFENQQGDGTREENTSLAIFREATQWLDAYFKGDNPEITIPLKANR